MADAPLSIMLDMALLVLDNTVGTLLSIFGLFGELVGSMLGVSSAGGMLGTLLFFIVLITVGVLVLRFLMGGVKLILLLFLGLLAILAFVAIGAGLA